MWRFPFSPTWTTSIILAALPASSHAEVRYTVKDLGALESYIPGTTILVKGGASLALDINATGDVVGGAYTPGNPLEEQFHAVISRGGGSLTDLGAALPGPSEAVGINSSGQILIRTIPSVCYLYSNGTYTNLGTLGGDVMVANAINDSGHVVGYATVPSSNEAHAFRYSNGMMHDLGTLGGLGAYANAINNTGQIVGDRVLVRDGAAGTYGFLFTDGIVQNLGLHASPKAINDAGEIVGSMQIDEGDGVRNFAFCYRNEKLTRFDAFADYSSAEAINNAGTIVGTAKFGPGIFDFRAVIFEEGNVVDLNTLISPSSGFKLFDARGINDSGQIVGSGYAVNGSVQHAFLLTPIPEPNTLTVIILGASTLLSRRRID